MRIAVTAILFLFSLQNVFSQNLDKLKISRLTGDFYVFTTYNFYKSNRIPANGMYVVTNAGVVLIDSPWDTTQFQPLLDSIRVRHDKEVLMCIATHFHDDRTGGLEYYKQKGIKTYTTKKTDELSKRRGMKRADFLIEKDTVFKIGQHSFQAYFPGHGHAPDNIIIWFENEKVLYGGCLIKSTVDSDLGNLSDASVTDYPSTLMNVKKKCRDPKYIIPGHDNWTSIKSLDHTLKMAQRLKIKKSTE